MSAHSSKISEEAIELLAIEHLEAAGYTYLHGGIIAPDGDAPERDSYEDVLLIGRVEAAINRLNPHVPANARLDALRQLQRLNAPELIANNEAFHRLLTEGIPVTYQKDGNARGDLVWLVDFDLARKQRLPRRQPIHVIENGVNKRPDVILFINGLPSSSSNSKTPPTKTPPSISAYKQLQTYKETIPSLFTYNGLLVISDGLEASAGSLSARLHPLHGLENGRWPHRSLPPHPANAKRSFAACSTHPPCSTSSATSPSSKRVKDLSNLQELTNLKRKASSPSKLSKNRRLPSILRRQQSG